MYLQSSYMVVMILPRHNSEPDWINKSQSDILPTEICMDRKLENQVTHIQEVVVAGHSALPGPFSLFFSTHWPFLASGPAEQVSELTIDAFFPRDLFSTHTRPHGFKLGPLLSGMGKGWTSGHRLMGESGTILHSHKAFEIETRNELHCITYCC